MSPPLSWVDKNDNNFTGLELTNKKLKSYKISQYADDLSLYLGCPEQILCALDIVIYFGNIAGLTLIMEKTEGLLIGSLRNANIIIEGIKF